MGELANDKMNGLSCYYCGVYFEKEHGYPVLCKSCWDDFIPHPPNHQVKKSGLSKARYREL